MFLSALRSVIQNVYDLHFQCFLLFDVRIFEPSTLSCRWTLWPIRALDYLSHWAAVMQTGLPMDRIKAIMAKKAM